MDVLYNAARWASIGNEESTPDDDIEEDLNDKTFNFRLPGLNLDYMSYAMFSLVQKNPQALLDLTTLHRVANEVFSTFFQHYASNNVSLTDGGRVFQPIGASLPFGLPPIVNFSTNQASSYQDSNIRPPTNLNNTIEATIHYPVNELIMSPTAVYLCLAILTLLTGIASLVYFFPHNAAQFKNLPRDMETLASIIALVYDSPKLQEWVQVNEEQLRDVPRATRGEKKNGTFRYKKEYTLQTPTPTTTQSTQATKTVSHDIKTGLGFFRGENGGGRWGVEVEPVIHAHPRQPYTTLLTTSEEE